MHQWYVLALSFVFIFAVIGLSTAFYRLTGLDRKITRKIVHIGVAHWWIIALAGIDSLWIALIGPVTFIVLNALSVRFTLISAMETEEPSQNLGTVYFPFSLVVLVLLCWGGSLSFAAGTIGVLVLGWGDGMAALIGENYGKHTFSILGGRKSIEGTVTMFAFSFGVVLISLGFFGYAGSLGLIPAALIIAAAATCIEVLTPLGIDNISVPILTALISSAIL